MAYEELRERVYRANLALVDAGLVVLTWGNASATDRRAGVMAIKPSGVAYGVLTPADIPVLSLETGQVIDGQARPSSDTPTHWNLYRAFEDANAIVHTHSTYATCFAQANRPIPCLGTTHADNFYGDIPCTRQMTPDEINGDYELNTGKVIVETFTNNKIDPMQIPGCLVASHAPFAWGASADKAVENAIVLEFAAQISLHSAALNPQKKPISQVLLDKHFFRKHGAKAYYGQHEPRTK